MNSATSKFLSTATLAMALFGASIGTSMAQDAQPSIKFNLFEATGVTLSTIINLDEEFAAKNEGLEIRAPFKIHVTQQDGITPLYNVGDGTTGEILKISFTTGDRNTPISERKLVENIRFVSMSLPLGDQSARLESLADLIGSQIYIAAVDGYEQNEYIGAKSSTFGDLVVIEAVGKYIDPSLGLMFLHIVGYPNPNDANSIFAVSSIVADKFEFETFDDLEFTGGGRTLASFAYLGE